MPTNCTKKEFTLPVEKIDNPAKTTHSVARQYSKAIVLTPPGESKPRILNFTSIGYEIYPNENWVGAIEATLNELKIEHLSAFSHIDWGRYCARWTFKQSNTIDSCSLSPSLQVLSSYNDLIAFRLVGGFYDAKFKTHIFLDTVKPTKHIKKDKNVSFKNANSTQVKNILEAWETRTQEQVSSLMDEFDIESIAEVLSPLRLIPKKTHQQIQSLWEHFQAKTKYDFLAIVAHLIEESPNEMGFEVRAKVVSDLYRILTNN